MSDNTGPGDGTGFSDGAGVAFQDQAKSGPVVAGSEGAAA